MRKKRTLTLNYSQLETQLRLKLQLSPYISGSTVDENTFKICKRPTGLAGSRGSLPTTFCFYGTYHQFEDSTQLTYQVRSGISAFIIYTLLGSLTLYMLYRVIFLDEPIVSVIFSLFFLLFFYLVKQLELKTCIADFEKQLTMEISRKK